MKSRERVHTVVVRLRRFLRDHLASCTAALLFALLLAEYWRRGLSLLDDGLLGNILTEALGILVTVVVIERLIGAPERRREKAVEKAAYQDISGIYLSALRLYSGPAVAGMVAPPAAEMPLFSPQLLIGLASLDMNSNALVIPPRPWRTLIRQQRNELVDDIRRATERYTPYCDPELLKAVRDLERSPYLGMLNVLDVVIQNNEANGKGARFLLVSEKDAPTFLPIEPLYRELRALAPVVGADPGKLQKPIIIPKE